MKIVVVLFTLFSFGVCAEEAAFAQKEVSGAKTVTAVEAKSLIDKNDEVVVIDSRSRNQRIIGYIYESINLPDEDTTVNSLAQAVAVKQTPVIFYCSGVNGGFRSARAARIAVDAGYNKVFWFKGGFQAWKENHYPIQVN